MANMSYCRWHNTYQDFTDCVYNMQFWLEDNPGKTWEDYVKTLNSDEQTMFRCLMRKVTEFQDIINQETDEEEDVDSIIAEGERNSNEIDLAWSEMGLKSDK